VAKLRNVRHFEDEEITTIQVSGYTHSKLTEWINEWCKNPKNTSFESGINQLIDNYDARNTSEEM